LLFLQVKNNRMMTLNVCAYILEHLATVQTLGTV
jgi:hypothetical protein